MICTFSNPWYIFQVRYPTDQMCWLTQRWIKSFLNCETFSQTHPHTYTPTCTRARTHTHTHTKSLIYTVSFIRHLLLWNIFGDWCVFFFVLPAYLRSPPALVATAVAVFQGGWGRARRKPPHGGASTTGGGWRWRATAPRRRRTPPRVKWKGPHP